MYVFGKNVAYDTLMGKTTVKKCFLDKDTFNNLRT